MKLIVTGGTGFVGSEVVRQLERQTDVEHVTCLSRRPVATTSAKIETLSHQDFAAYDEELALTLADHDGCIWALGGKASDRADLAEYERATVTFTTTFASVIAERLSHPFRFCYLSGMGADPTESAWFPWERNTRHLKGRAERKLASLSAAHPLFRATAFRPGGILEPTTSRLIASLLAPIAVPVARVARSMIDEAVGGRSTTFRVVANSEIRLGMFCGHDADAPNAPPS